MTPPSAAPALDVLVIGGGQAGLAMGYHLARRGLAFEVVEAASEVGAAWRSRWDSLRAFTPAQYDNLPGLAFPAPPDTYPGKDDVADYLQAYAARFELPVRAGTRVTSLSRSEGVYRARAKGEAWEARQVVVATGPFQVPFIPPIAEGLDPGVCQLHSADYRNPAAIPAGRVLVVGAANPAPRDGRGRPVGEVRRRRCCRVRCGGVGDRVHDRPLVDRCARRAR
jgi:putative flavoprotein involved in K+ transport